MSFILVQAVYSTFQAEDSTMAMEINEMEEYLGLLREKQAAVQMKLRQADEEIGGVWGAFHSDGISELSPSDESDEIKHVTSEDVIPPFLSYLSNINDSDPEEYSTDSFAESHKSSGSTPFAQCVQSLFQ